MLLRSRIVLPLCAPPIEDGAVLISGERIKAVGCWNDLRNAPGGEVVDFGDAILLPGLINAHCHLDYTDMAGQLSPSKNCSDWVKAIVALKAGWSYTDFALSWINGARMLLRSGTTTVVDIEAVPELLPEVTMTTPLRVISCLELLSVRQHQKAREIVQVAAEQLDSIAASWVGLSPHAPYSTSSELLRAAGRSARERGWLLTTHVAESMDEFQMFKHARGAMYRWLKRQRDMSDCDGCSPVAHLARHGLLGPDFIAVHANYLAAGDVELLARSGATVVHCPRSHAFFGHRAFPLERLEKAGVNICLGTDSLATISKSRYEPLTLNMFSEMHAFAKAFPALSPERILRAATIDAAEALNRVKDLGAIASGAYADLIAVPFSGRTGKAAEAVLNHRGDVLASMIAGKWALHPRYS